MIFFAITSIFLFGLACNYFGYKKGLKEGIEMTKRDYNSKLNEYMDQCMEKQMNIIMEKCQERFLKDEINGKDHPGCDKEPQQ